MAQLIWKIFMQKVKTVESTELLKLLDKLPLMSWCKAINFTNKQLPTFNSTMEYVVMFRKCKE